MSSAAWLAVMAAWVACSAPTASSRSFLLTAFCSTRGFMRSRLAFAVSHRARCSLSCPFASSSCRLKGPGIDPEKDLSSFDDVALAVVAGDEIALDLGADRGIDEPVGGGGPFRIDGHVPLYHLCHLHEGGRRALRGLRLLTSGEEKGNTAEQEDCCQGGKAVLAHRHYAFLSMFLIICSRAFRIERRSSSVRPEKMRSR